MRIGLLGGTFDPIHIGHILLGQFAKEAFALDEVWFLPAGAPYQKALTQVTPPEARLEMTEISLRGLPGLRACDIEVRREGNSYTCETVEALKAQHPEHDFYTILGADCLDSLLTWHQPERILAASDIVAAARAGSDLEAMNAQARTLEAALGGKIHVMPFPCIDLSSTLIRQRAAQGLPLRFMVPESVEQYIHDHQLYR